MQLGPRIMIVGGPGSGKSTLARALAAKLGLPLYHMDQIHWLPGWIERDMDQRREMALAIERQESWVFEGSLQVTNAHRLSRASALIWLDLPLSLRLYRALRRSAAFRGQTRPDLPENCPERFGLETLKFLRYIISTHKSYRRRMTALIEGAPGKPVYHLKSAREVEAFLAAARG